MKRIIFIVLILLFSIHLTSDEMKKHPGWAIVTSAVLPGGGQFYAESYVRGIFFSTLQISLISLTVYEKVQERDYWKLYNENHEQDTWHKFNKHKSRVRNLLWWDAGIWFLSCADAFADAHFYGFNDVEGFSLQLEQKAEGMQIGVIFKF
ncbi:MAG: hypothetical protein E3J87_09875 [Candidatus Cloacimonadota bacterium]|nr:MAG: hypothetical protein E3J87_09875 [Candidatus Cloacimonadota bacterium]